MVDFRSLTSADQTGGMRCKELAAEFRVLRVLGLPSGAGWFDALAWLLVHEASLDFFSVGLALCGLGLESGDHANCCELQLSLPFPAWQQLGVMR